MSRRPRFTLEQATRIARAYRRGWSAKQLAARVGCTHQTILNYLERLGVAVRPRGCRVRRRVAA